MCLSVMCYDKPSKNVRLIPLPFYTFFLLCILFFLTTTCIASTPLIITTSVGPPGSNKSHTGLYDLLLQEAFRRINQQIDIERLPAERALMNADSGLTDGECPRISGLENLYPNLTMVPERFGDYEFIAFSKPNGKKIYSWDDLEPYDVAFVLGWKILEKNIVKYRSLVRVKSQKLLFNLLVNNRADIVVYSRAAGDAYINSQGLAGQIVALEPPLDVRGMHLYLNKKHKQIVEPLSQALRDMRKDGTYTKIKNRVIGNPPK